MTETALIEISHDLREIVELTYEEISKCIFIDEYGRNHYVTAQTDDGFFELVHQSDTVMTRVSIHHSDIRGHFTVKKSLGWVDMAESELLKEGDETFIRCKLKLMKKDQEE